MKKSFVNFGCIQLAHFKAYDTIEFKTFKTLKNFNFISPSLDLLLLNLYEISKFGFKVTQKPTKTIKLDVSFSLIFFYSFF